MNFSLKLPQLGFLTQAIRFGLTTCAIGALTIGSALASPIVTYSVNQDEHGVEATAAGTVTVTANNANELQVTFTLAPNMIINTGGPHTPFAFNSSVALSSPAITVTAPVGTVACAPALSPCFTPTYASGMATPFGSLNEAFNYTGDTGGVGGNAGPLIFTIDGTGFGVFDTTTHLYDLFTANSYGAIFAADISINGNTGTWVAKSGTCTSDCNGDGANGSGDGTPVPAPEPGSLAILGAALMGLAGIVTRRRQKLS